MLATTQGEPRLYSRAPLVDELNKPVKASELVTNRNYLFHYRYAGTPAFLINLDRPTSQNGRLTTAEGNAYEQNRFCNNQIHC